LQLLPVACMGDSVFEPERDHVNGNKNVTISDMEATATVSITASLSRYHHEAATWSLCLMSRTTSANTTCPSCSRARFCLCARRCISTIESLPDVAHKADALRPADRTNSIRSSQIRDAQLNLTLGLDVIFIHAFMLSFEA